MHTTRQAQAFVRARASDGHLVAKKGVTSTTFSKAVYFSKYPRKLLSLTVDTNLQLEAKNPVLFFFVFFYNQSIKEEIHNQLVILDPEVNKMTQLSMASCTRYC